MAPARLLIVDDDDSLRLVCRRFFERSPPPRGVVITEAESGEQAIEFLAERDFDCIVCDYRMGAVTGIDVLAYAMKVRPRAARIMMTGYASDALKLEALREAHVHEFFEKPAMNQELEDALRERVLERYLKQGPPVSH